MPHKQNARKRPYADLSDSLLKLTLAMGAWGKSRGNRKLTTAEAAALRGEWRRRHGRPDSR